MLNLQVSPEMHQSNPCMREFAKKEDSTFNAALPYAAGTLGAGAVGALLAISASSTAAIVAGVVLAILGAYSFLGVLTCGLYSKNVEEFHENVGKAMLTGAASGTADLIATVAKAVCLEMIFGRNR